MNSSVLPTKFAASICFAVSWLASSACWSDSIYLYDGGDPLVVEGKVISVSGGEVQFKVGCDGQVRRFTPSDNASDLGKYYRVDFNNACKKRYRIDATGGPETGCPVDSYGMESLKGAKKYHGIVTKGNEDWAFKTVVFSEDQLSGDLLITGRHVRVPRSKLVSYSPLGYDCFYKEFKHK